MVFHENHPPRSDCKLTFLNTTYHHPCIASYALDLTDDDYTLIIPLVSVDVAGDYWVKVLTDFPRTYAQLTVLGKHVVSSLVFVAYTTSKTRFDFFNNIKDMQNTFFHP